MAQIADKWHPLRQRAMCGRSIRKPVRRNLPGHPNRNRKAPCGWRRSSYAPPAQLLELVAALHAASRLVRASHRRQQYRSRMPMRRSRPAARRGKTAKVRRGLQPWFHPGCGARHKRYLAIAGGGRRYPGRWLPGASTRSTPAQAHSFLDRAGQSRSRRRTAQGPAKKLSFSVSVCKPIPAVPNVPRANSPRAAVVVASSASNKIEFPAVNDI